MIEYGYGLEEKLFCHGKRRKLNLWVLTVFFCSLPLSKVLRCSVVDFLDFFVYRAKRADLLTSHTHLTSSQTTRLACFLSCNGEAHCFLSMYACHNLNFRKLIFIVYGKVPSGFHFRIDLGAHSLDSGCTLLACYHGAFTQRSSYWPS
jgi:hypothetical protein